MKKRMFHRWIPLLLILPLLLSMISCHPDGEQTTTGSSTTAATTTAANLAEQKQTTEAPTTEVPATEIPTTEIPTTEVPTTETPTTEIPTTEPITTIPPVTDPLTFPTAAATEEEIAFLKQKIDSFITDNPVFYHYLVDCSTSENEIAAEEIKGYFTAAYGEFASIPQLSEEETATFDFLKASTALRMFDETVFHPEASGENVYLVLIFTSETPHFRFTECTGLVRDGDRLKVELCAELGERVDFPVQTLLFFRINKESLGGGALNALDLRITAVNAPPTPPVQTTLDWGDYTPTEEEIAFAEALPEIYGLPKQINLNIRLAFGTTPSIVQDYGITLIAVQGDTYAVYLTGLYTIPGHKTDSYGSYQFKYSNSETIRIYRDGQLLTMREAYNAGWIDNVFLQRIYNSPNNTFR